MLEKLLLSTLLLTFNFYRDCRHPQFCTKEEKIFFIVKDFFVSQQVVTNKKDQFVVRTSGC